MPMVLRKRASPQAAQHRDKRRTKRHSSRTDQDLPPPRFWDNLSHIPLVKRALRELDRRNNTTQPREEGSETLPPSPGDPRRLEAGKRYQNIKRFSRTGGPDLSDLRGYAYSPTKLQAPTDRQGQRRRRSIMPGRGSTRGGRPPVSGRGKRKRNHTGEPADSEDEPRARGRGGRQLRAGGRAKGADLRHKSVTAAQDKSTTTTTGTSTKSGPYDPAFTQHLLDNNVLPLVWYWRHGQRPEPPANIEEIKAEVRASRDPEPAEDFQRFRDDYEKAKHEDNVLSMLDILQGDSQALSQSHDIRQKKKMGNLKPLTDGSIPPGNPDRVYGASASELEVSVRDDLDDVIVPTRERDFICPNFVVHVKSDEGNLTVARAQAAYDGALAARGMESLWAYGNRAALTQVHNRGSGRGRRTRVNGAVSDGFTAANPDVGLAHIARTITCTWHGGVLKMYAIYCQLEPAAGNGARAGNLASKFPRYVPSLIGSWIMTDREEDFRGGVAAYRNGLDWAKRQRDMVISRANARARGEEAHGSRGEEEDSGEEPKADEEVQSDGENSGEEEDNHEQENKFEVEDSSEEDDGGSSSIFAGRGSGASVPDEGDKDSDPADDDIYQSFDSQRTVTTRSMSRRQSREKRP